MAKGLVYILTNPCLEGWVKIGMTERNDIERRVQELNAPPNLLLSFRCYAVYEVEDPAAVEAGIHSIIDRVDGSLHAREQLENGRMRQREFFKISPEAAYGVFKDIAALRGDEDKLKLYAPTASQAREQEIAERRTKRANSSFALLGLRVGDAITFVYDQALVARVADRKNRIEFEAQTYSVTGLARKLLSERYGWAEGLHVNGWKYFTKDGVTLSDLRDSMESEEAEDE